MELKEWWQQHQRKLFLLGGALIIVILAFMIVKMIFFEDESPIKDQSDGLEHLSDVSSQEEVEGEVIAFADIKGAVMLPGMYQINENTRLQDLIGLAGGLTADAESRHLNLSLLIQDQMMVYVPFQGEEYTGEEETIAMGNSQGNHGGKEPGVNLNTADVNELQKLNGIGEKKAEAIIAYREEVGSFKKIEDLKEVNGIGEKTFENLKEDITIK